MLLSTPDIAKPTKLVPPEHAGLLGSVICPMREPSMGEVSTIGLDSAKSLFQVHRIDVTRAVLIKRVSRAKVLEYFCQQPRCLVGIEA